MIHNEFLFETFIMLFAALFILVALLDVYLMRKMKRDREKARKNMKFRLPFLPKGDDKDE